MTSKHIADSLGDRMKQYESVTQSSLMKRMPTIIRIDGKAFHTFTKCLTDTKHDPFSTTMHNSMVHTTQELVTSIQNAVFAYTQSDEISILLRDWDNLQTQQWFNGNVQKIVSVSASMATRAFINNFCIHSKFPALFDSRVFQLPEHEVTNYFIWRQADATRNSVQMLGRHYFSHEQMMGKSNQQIQDMLLIQHDVSWNSIDTWKKRGTCVISGKHGVVDDHIPIFTQDRNYSERMLHTHEDQQ